MYECSLCRIFREQRRKIHGSNRKWLENRIDPIPTIPHNPRTFYREREICPQGRESKTQSTFVETQFGEKHSPETEVARRRLSIRNDFRANVSDERGAINAIRGEGREGGEGTLRRRRRGVGRKCRRKAVRKAPPPASKLQSSARGSDRRPPINQMERLPPSSQRLRTWEIAKIETETGVERKKRNREFFHARKETNARSIDRGELSRDLWEKVCA